MGSLDSIVRSAERLCEGEICCSEYRRKVSALCLLYKINHRENHPLNGYLNHFVAARNTKTSTALGVLALVIPRYRTDKFSRSFLPAALRLWNLLQSGMLRAGILSLFKSAVTCAY